MNRITGILMAVCLLTALLITSVEAVVYWIPGYFPHEYEKHQVLDDVHMSMDDLLSVTEHMMDYLRGEEEELQVSTTIRGIVHVPFFNEREILHMEDVRNLFLGGLALRRIALLLFVLGLFILYRRKALSSLPKSICIGTGIFLGVVILLAILFSTDFTRYFTIFHLIFFDNDLWILNPMTDRLINIVPEPFFIDTAIAIALVFTLSILCTLFISLYLHKRNSR